LLSIPAPPANVAPLVAWRCSTESAAVSGRVFEVSGDRITLCGGRELITTTVGGKLATSPLSSTSSSPTRRHVNGSSANVDHAETQTLLATTTQRTTLCR
jgi:hypothetical protein